MELARVIISIVLALMLLVTGGGKVVGLKYANGNRESLGVHPVFWRVIGILELAAAVGLVWGIWFVPFGLAAAVGVALLMLGAVGFRIRTRDTAIMRQSSVDSIVFALAAVVAVFSVLAL
jgi:uncharacterized membrane protein YphA (DoxX/SURF4 family)